MNDAVDLNPAVEKDAKASVMTGTGSGSEWLARYSSSLMGVFGTPQRVLVRGAGCLVWDADGKEYLDLLGGIAVNALGHANPFVTSVISSQLATLGHVSNFFTSPTQIALAEKLLAITDAPAGSKVFFTNSGTEANEAALKLTRRTGRTHVVAMENGFHGRTMGALALTSKAAYREPFEPLPGGVQFVPYGDADALKAAVTDETAAVVVEPMQGEAGVVEPPEGYLEAVRRVTSEHGTLMWVDEVQTGVGRTGAWFAHTAQLPEGVLPDVVTVAKGLGGGIPIGACIALGDAGDLLQPGHHGTTFGGNPVATAAALAVIETIEKDGLLGNATRVGEQLRTGLAHDRVTEIRGSGLLAGIDLDAEIAPQVVQAAQDAGFILNATGPRTIRLAPPLVLTAAQAGELVDAWPTILEKAGVSES